MLLCPWSFKEYLVSDRRFDELTEQERRSMVAVNAFAIAYARQFRQMSHQIRDYLLWALQGDAHRGLAGADLVIAALSDCATQSVTCRRLLLLLDTLSREAAAEGLSASERTDLLRRQLSRRQQLVTELFATVVVLQENLQTIIDVHTAHPTFETRHPSGLPPLPPSWDNLS